MNEKNIGDVYGHPAEDLLYERSVEFPTNNRIGLEIELEGFLEPFDASDLHPYWEVINDDSLRDYGKEFRFTRPIFGLDLSNALSQIEEFLSDYQKLYGTVCASDRTSVHAHIDVRDMNVSELVNLQTLYLTVEKLLYHVAGSGRYDNIYCLPSGEMRDTLNRMSMLVAGDPHTFVTGCAKYEAFNSLSIQQRGSIEFRHHEGTTDIGRLRLWCRALISLKEAARGKAIDIDHLPAQISAKGLIDFVKDLFGDDYHHFIHKNFHNDLLDGIRNAQEVIYSSLLEKENTFLKRGKSKGVVGNDSKDLLSAYAKVNGIELMEEVS